MRGKRVSIGLRAALVILAVTLFVTGTWACQSPGAVTVIDGATNHHTTVTVGSQPWWGDLDAETNQIYVAVHYDTDVAVIDGATNNTSFVSLPDNPVTLAVDKSTNKIYVVLDQYLSMIDGLTKSVNTITVGNGPDALAINETNNRIYVANYSDNTISVVAGASAHPAQFVAVIPCRLVDTRLTGGPIQGGTFRNFYVPQLGGCNIPLTAVAYSLNVTVVPITQLSYLSIWPTGEDRPLVSTLNSLDGRIKGDAAIVPSGYRGAVSVYVTQTTNVILDINGYFAPVSGSTLAFYPLAPCRVADTRSSSYPPGLGPPYLTGGQERAFPILNATSCNIPSSAAAYSLNLFVVPHGPLDYLTVWPTGLTRPLVYTLNDVPGAIIANAAIVPAGTGGEISAYPSNDTDLIIDINGYFGPAGPGGLSLYPMAPCRVIDTRHVRSGQPFSGMLSPPVDVVHSPCGPPVTAQAYVFNATVVPTGGLAYLTLWPDGDLQPPVSTLTALDGSISSNMAIVPSINGKVDAYATDLTQLILDISAFFAP